MENEIYRFVAGRSLVEPEQAGHDASDPNKCLEIIQMADIPSAGSSKRNQAKGKGKKDVPKPTRTKTAVVKSSGTSTERGINFCGYCLSPDWQVIVLFARTCLL